MRAVPALRQSCEHCVLSEFASGIGAARETGNSSPGGVSIRMSGAPGGSGTRGCGRRRLIVKRFLGPALAMALLLTSAGGVLAAKSDKEEMVICPVLKQKVPKSKAIK